MVEVCLIPYGEWYVCILPFSSDVRIHLLKDNNPTGFLTINDLNMEVYVAHFHIFAPCMSPLEHISNRLDNMVTKIWSRSGGISSPTAV